MNDEEIHHEQRTGEVCWRCDCELVLVSTGSDVAAYLECDCGTVGCQDSSRGLVSSAA